MDITNEVHRNSLVWIQDLVREMRSDGEDAMFDMIMRRDSDGSEVNVHVTVRTARTGRTVRTVRTGRTKVDDTYLLSTSDPNLYWGNGDLESPEDLLELSFKTRDGSAFDVLHFVRIN